MKTPYKKFVSGVKGRLVSRYGSARATHAADIIGGVKLPFVAVDPSKPIDTLTRGAAPVEIDEDIVIALSETEWSTYQREYTRALRDGSLVERSEDDYLAYTGQTPKKKKERS